MITIIAGPPGSGKTRFVETMRHPGDLVWDLDAVAGVLAGMPVHPRPSPIVSCLHAIRSTLVRWLSQNRGTVAYLIVTDPQEAQQVAQECGGTAMVLDLTTRART